MLRAQLRRQSQAGTKAAGQVRIQNMVVFSVGGKRLAARTEEIGGVFPWPGATAVPSDTRFVTSLVRHDETCLPVFDLAAKFDRKTQGVESLCLVVKHVDGPLAICIDSQVPSLHAVPRAALQYQLGDDPDIAGSCLAGDEQLPLINLATLGVTSSRPA